MRLPRVPRLTRRAQIAVNLVLWWALNVVFNLANKQCLNSWPHPWGQKRTAVHGAWLSGDGPYRPGWWYGYIVKYPTHSRWFVSFVPNVT